MTPSLLSIHDLHVVDAQTGRGLLEELSLEIRPGERLGIVGASGAGKTLLGRALIGDLPEGVELRSGTVDRGGHRVTMVPQIGSSALPPLLNPLRLVADVVRWTDPLPRAQAWARARVLLESVGLSEASGLALKRPHALSGGMAARVCIAAALATAPKVLVLDEPTNGLDPLSRSNLIDLLLEVNGTQAIGLVVLTHDMWLVSRLCERTVVLRSGRRVDVGSPAELAQRDPESYTGKLFRPLRESPT